MTSTDLAVIEPSGFVALADDLSEITTAIEENLGGQEIGPQDLVRLIFPSGKPPYRWEVPTLEGSAPQDEVRGVVILHQSTRAWWPTSIDEGGSGNPPSCTSPDGKLGFGKQWATAADRDPQDRPPVQLACAQCPHSQFGSAPDGPGQACQQKAQIFVLAETGFLPFVIAAPSKSLKPWRRYLVGLSNAGVAYSSVVTGFRLAKDRNAGGTEHAVLEPYLAGRLSPDAIAKARAYAEALRPQLDAVANEPIVTEHSGSAPSAGRATTTAATTGGGVEPR